ncbi:flagellar basal body P-ring formation chaperone FlgA [Helicobacter sp. 13S00477-4]|uniref:flagellar basal body P-ring formation chaperone FlgA n=1 Tax=Helicobacter sp. 13S00477-4 TaxID=1905759 RepID=UPI000BD9E555|nr:flagellar basal body P-ring formation chaperone FlgA [Helicobacter sp. 13S00477-4]PAF50825.1 flagella basal body P-ring formation protein FlgA [Helicobacter sp. 13S00477-4]
MLRLFLFLLLSSYLWASNNIDQIKNYIQNAYEKQYKNYNIHITNISLSIPANIPLQDYKIISIDMDSKSLNKKSANIFLNATLNNTILKIPLQYEIQATIDVYKSTSTIKKYQNITDANTIKTQIPLERIAQLPIIKDQINHISAKSYTPPNSIITSDKIQSKILIYKDNRFVGIIKNNHINIETTLIAKENGSKNQIINAINPDTKKVIRVKIIDENKGEIL